MSILKAAIENLAERIAASKGGRITANDLMPYFPVSLEMLARHLDDMVDDSVVASTHENGFRTYEFIELLDAPWEPLPRGICLYSGEEIDPGDNRCFSPKTWNQLKKELLDEAERNAWPADAVWQHELLYITSRSDGLIRIADVAGKSRLTLKQVKQRLHDLTRLGAARQILDYEMNTSTYSFPEIDYRRKSFFRHDAFIREHPSSLKDEFEVKLMKTLLTLTGIAIFCLVLAFVARIPFIILLLAGVAAGTLSSLKILRSKTTIVPGRISNGTD